jgi:hypothetical protein
VSESHSGYGELATTHVAFAICILWYTLRACWGEEEQYELRVSYGPGCLLYFYRRDEEIVWLLLGGDKSSRQRDIKRAQQLNREYE